jgi:hypothetical protein
VRSLPLPTLTHETTYDTCVGSIGNVELQQRFGAIRQIILDQGVGYVASATAHQLYLHERTDAKNEDYVVGQVTRGELRELYSQQLATRKKPARSFYDQLLASVPHSRCPFCGMGHVSTLDHFLAQGNFPWFSVLPANLVPACKDCNHGKSNRTAASADQQVLHPYFSAPQIEADQWLYAAVQYTAPVSVTYHAQPPINWDGILRQRVYSHLRDFDLPRRFSIEAAEEISNLRPMLQALSVAGGAAIKEHLERQAEVALGIQRNSWKTALYQVLASNEWYCAGGYAATA